MFTNNVMGRSLVGLRRVGAKRWQCITTAFLHRRVGIVGLLVNEMVSYLGTLARSLFFMVIITGCKESRVAVQGWTVALTMVQMARCLMWQRTKRRLHPATTKVVDAEWHQILLRGIGAKYVPSYSSHMPRPNQNITAG